MKPSKLIRIFILVVCANTAVALSAQARDSIKIASLYAFTGAAAKANLLSVQSIRFAVDEINAHGGVLGLPLELIEIDNQSSPIGSKVAAEQAVAAEVVAILGASWSSHTLQAAKVAQAHGIPLISNVSTHPGITGIGDFIFRVCFNDLYQGWAMARFAHQDLGLHRAVVLIDITSDYSIGLAQSFASTFESMGGEILTELNYKRRQQNFTDLVAQAARHQPDILFLPGHDESALILTEAQRSGLQAVFLGADGWDVENFYAMGGNKVKQAFFTTHWSEEMNNAASLAFVQKYKKQKPIFAQEALGYDAVNLLADALERAGRPEPEALRDALAQTTAFQGVTGVVAFDANGDPIKGVIIMEMKEGVPRYLQSIQPLQPPDFSVPSSQRQFPDK